MLEMGASGAQLGTRFAAATESIAHANFKRAFMRAARWKSDSTSMGERSRIETRSRPGIVLTAGCGIGGAVNVWLLNDLLLSLSVIEPLA